MAYPLGRWLAGVRSLWLSNVERLARPDSLGRTPGFHPRPSEPYSVSVGLVADGHV